MILLSKHTWTKCLFITCILLLILDAFIHFKNPKTELVPAQNQRHNISSHWEQLPQTQRANQRGALICWSCNNSSWNNITVPKSIPPSLNNRYLIIGAISHPGYIITSILREYRNLTTKVTEDISSLGFDSGTWRHYNRLKIEANVTPSIIDYSDHNVLKSQLKWVQGGTVVYIPSLLFNAINKDSFFDVNYISSIIKNFGNLLELLTSMLHGQRKITKIVYFTPENENVQSNQHATVLRLLSFVLSSYATQNIKVVLISFTACTDTVPHSMLGCNHNMAHRVIESVVLNHTGSNVQCNQIQIECCDDAHPLSVTKLHGRVPIANREYIVGVDLHGARHKDNSFVYMHGFYLSCVKQNLDMLIFHNHLNSEMRYKLSRFHHNNTIVFVDVDKHGLHGKLDNDARYFFLFDYLVNHPEIKAIIFQDIKDGAFYMNPFQVMDGIGNNLLFSGTDRAFSVAPAFHGITRVKFRNCHKNALKSGQANLHPFYNAGTFGGSRDVILTYLQRLMVFLKKTPSKFRCNMATNYLVIQKYFKSHSYSGGYPFMMYHGADFGIPSGLAVKHKEAYPYKMMV